MEYNCGRCRTLLRTAINKNEDSLVTCDVCGQKMHVSWSDDGRLFIKPLPSEPKVPDLMNRDARPKDKSREGGENNG